MRQEVFDCAPPTRDIIVAFRQRPDRVHVVGEHHPGVDAERGERANAANRMAEVFNAARQQTRPTVGKVNGKIAATGDPQAAVFRHLTARSFEAPC